ncbi:hypothetical protein SDC9_183244 [bioreactor metagenome]|uniref:Uncharacterized protein n=1 Tax=bioreactor metagenome TaxID=1076179 RepID=A0A645H9R2_9ZZZZ
MLFHFAFANVGTSGVVSAFGPSVGGKVFQGGYDIAIALQVFTLKSGHYSGTHLSYQIRIFSVCLFHA